MEFKGQGSLEYLLMIAAGVGIAAIVLIVVMGMGASQKCNTFQTTVESLCATKMTVDSCENAILYPGQLGTDDQCIWDTTSAGAYTCQVNQSDAAWDWSDNEEGACPA